MTVIAANRPTRSLRLSGGPLDGSSWSADIDVGGRICGPGPWMSSHVYVVTAQLVRGPNGGEESVAVPADF